MDISKEYECATSKWKKLQKQKSTTLLGKVQIQTTIHEKHMTLNKGKGEAGEILQTGRGTRAFVECLKKYVAVLVIGTHDVLKWLSVSRRLLKLWHPSHFFMLFLLFMQLLSKHLNHNLYCMRVAHVFYDCIRITLYVVICLTWYMHWMFLYNMSYFQVDKYFCHVIWDP